MLAGNLSPSLNTMLSARPKFKLLIPDYQVFLQWSCYRLTPLLLCVRRTRKATQSLRSRAGILCMCRSWSHVFYSRTVYALSLFSLVFASAASYFDIRWRVLSLKRCPFSNPFVLRSEADFKGFNVSLVSVSWLSHIECCTAKVPHKDQIGQLPANTAEGDWRRSGRESQA